jgi:uncharacterized protein YbbK (DUF523 family)
VKPRVVISRCLLGEDVRYDGTNKLSAAVIELGTLVEWVPVCPEVEVGMGVPREPIQLVARTDGVPSANEYVRLQGVSSREDWTDRMRDWTRARVEDLRAQRISGFVLKARSPSCGPAAVLVHHSSGAPTAAGRGLFAEALATLMPDLPTIDEEALADLEAREHFIERVRAFFDTARTST